jgi:hypothetical protein
MLARKRKEKASSANQKLQAAFDSIVVSCSCVSLSPEGKGERPFVHVRSLAACLCGLPVVENLCLSSLSELKGDTAQHFEAAISWDFH